MANLGASNHVARVLSAANRLADAGAASRIAVSWRRCLLNHKLDPARDGPPQTLTQSEIRRITGPMEGLIRIAIPELEDLSRVLRESGYCVNLADMKGTMLISRLPGGNHERTFRDLKIYTGSNFSEEFEGTNGVGTALAEQRPILVHRDEHFRERWSVFTCGVAPLFDQRGILAGAVNISSCRSDLDRWGMQHEAAPFDDARPHSLTTLSLLSPGASDAKVLAGKRSQRDGVGDWDAVKLLPFFSTSVRVPRSENRRG